MNKGMKQGIMYAIALIAIATVIFYFANGGTFSLSNGTLFGGVTFDKIGSTYQVNQLIETGGGTEHRYRVYTVNYVKVNGVSVPVVYPDSIPATFYSKTVCPGRIAVGLGDVNYWHQVLTLYSKDVSGYSGTNTIEISFSRSYEVMSGALPEFHDVCSNVWDTQIYTDTFTNTGQNITVCGNGQCESPETFQSCPADCPTTACNNDGTCQASESTATCPADCPPAPTCGDQTCNGVETCSSCPSDCGACIINPTCGDKVCNGLETCSTCAGDCGACSVTPVDNTLYMYGAIGLIVIGGSLYMIFRKK